ncbi:ribosomal protein S4 [Ammonifex degensii KC4]|uniref:Small ribosomal subunit protein uS4 n=1 Tax=Ammonifex degensii (strain DSM 10501 / KC4) TaxID=429009 RepID=C9R8G3_AMMDK|nr:30S ribosomal protein S4 [Ammonifex degensii]ACX52592.1 ribosomal protein S4 [Ammonifex degensii KC4]
MARYTGPRCRLCRREGIKLYLKGDRCYTSKCALERRNYPPGQHGRVRRKMTEYAMQLREKQKAKRIYGVLEAQFRNYFAQAERQKGLTGENLLRLLERRLDNVVYRLGMAASRAEARQLVRHGHILVNGRRVDIPSYLVEVGDKISFDPRSKESPRIQELLERAAQNNPPPWLRYDPNEAIGEVLAFPTRDQIDVPVKEHLIVELYSR